MRDINGNFSEKRGENMTIIVYGMGIIGASLSASLKRAGHTVLGKNRSAEPLRYAVANGIIDGVAESYEGADAVFLALPPRVCMRELEEGNFPAGCVVSDVCGVKAPLERVVFSAPRSYRYVGIHPMAGRPTTGIRSSSADLFDGANLVIVRSEGTDEGALALLRSLAEDMRFGRIVECSASEHDEIIALTSQLAHVVSSAYVKSPLTGRARGFTGGSFQDMTRVAPMDDIWAELFILNREALLPEIERLRARLLDYAEALSSGDEEGLKALIRDGKAQFARFFSNDTGDN